MSMRMTSGFLFLLMFQCPEDSLIFLLDLLRERDCTIKGFRGSRVFVHVPILLFYYPEIQSAVPGDHQGLQCGLDIFPGRSQRKIFIVSRILCNNKIPLKLVLIDYNLSYLSSLKQIFIIWRYNCCGHFFLNCYGGWNVIIVTNYIYIDIPNLHYQPKPSLWTPDLYSWSPVAIFAYTSSPIYWALHSYECLIVLLP